jgi:hypothetical protein
MRKLHRAPGRRRTGQFTSLRKFSDGPSMVSAGAMKDGRLRVRVFVLALLIGAGGLVLRAERVPLAARETRVGVLVFGDSGYDYDWLGASASAHPRSAREFVLHELDDWLEKGRPVEEFQLPVMHRAEQTGGYVVASGLWPVARAMQSWCGTADRCRFGVMLGDNVYPNGATLGADGRDDAERFDALLRRPYAALRERNPSFLIHPVLGNHDWNTSREGAMAQVEFFRGSPLHSMDGIFYRAEAAPGVEIFAVDTTVLLAGAGVQGDPWLEPRGEEQQMVEWLEQALAGSTARWKLVIGHHPLWWASGREQSRLLREKLLPSLCRHADVYLAGHEHTLEVHTQDCSAMLGASAPPLLTVVSGAAGKQRPLDRAFLADQAARNPERRTLWARGRVWGFAHLALDANAGELTMLSTPDSGSGEPVVEFRHGFERRSGWKSLVDQSPVGSQLESGE